MIIATGTLFQSTETKAEEYPHINAWIDHEGFLRWDPVDGADYYMYSFSESWVGSIDNSEELCVDLRAHCVSHSLFAGTYKVGITAMKNGTQAASDVWYGYYEYKVPNSDEVLIEFISNGKAVGRRIGNKEDKVMSVLNADPVEPIGAKGYSLGGWCLDQDCTQEFKDKNMTFEQLKNENGGKLYAYWVEAYVRIYRESRLTESLKVADELMNALGIKKFNNLIIAKDSDFADALSGSYLAARKKAPILLINDSNHQEAYDYIHSSLKDGGTVYILGSDASVPSSFEDNLTGNYTIKRLEDTSRYLTNLEILKEAGMTSSKDIVICTGNGYADSLSAGAVGLPIMLVGDSLKGSQKTFLKENAKGKIFVLGQTASVNADVEKALKSYGNVTRIGGDSRWKTTRLVANQFFTDPEYVVLATGNDFADGLIASPLAYVLKSPLLMVASNKTAEAKNYVSSHSVQRAYIIGSKDYIDDAAVRKIVGVDEAVTILEK